MTSPAPDAPPPTFTAFIGQRLVAAGSLATVLPEVRAAMGQDLGALLIFADETGDTLEPDFRQPDADIVARYAPATESPAADKRIGRPRLGVVAREVTLLPRHWDWLATQPEGASAALRKLVEQARRESSGQDRARRAHRAVDRFLYRMAGDLPRFEEAYRAFYAADFARMDHLIEGWPTDICAHLRRLVAPLRATDPLVKT